MSPQDYQEHSQIHAQQHLIRLIVEVCSYILEVTHNIGSKVLGVMMMDNTPLRCSAVRSVCD